MTMEMWIASEIVGMQTFLYYCWWRWCHCSLPPWRMPVNTFRKWGMRFVLMFSILCPSCVRFDIVILDYLFLDVFLLVCTFIRMVNWIQAVKRPPKLHALVMQHATAKMLRVWSRGRLSRRKTGETSGQTCTCT